MKNWKTIFAFLAVYLGWGSTYLAIALALRDFQPFTLAGIRFLVAGAIFLLWCLWRGVKFPSVRLMLKQSVIGVLLLFLGSGSVVWVEQYLSSGLTSIIWASLPIWLILLDSRSWKQNFTNLPLMLGLVVGFAGVTTLVGGGERYGNASSANYPAVLVAFGGVISFAIGSLLSRYSEGSQNLVLTTSIQLMVAGTLALFFGLLVLDETLPDLASPSLIGSILSLIYLIVVGSLIAYSAYVWLIQVKPPSVVGTYTYVNPAVALILGWLFLGEDITFIKVVSLLIISIGVIIINIGKTKQLRYDRKNVARDRPA